jgi:hypothetical protein
MKDALDFRKDGNPGADRIKLLKELVAERMTGQNVSHYVTPAMQHGLDYEAEAKREYEKLTGRTVRPCETIDHPFIELLAATPDGLVEDGLIETKCPTTATHVDWMMGKVVPDIHKPQMLIQLACTGRTWVDFVSYDPRVKDKKLRLFLRRFEPTKEEIDSCVKQAEKFLDEVEAAFRLVTESEQPN